MKLPLEDIKVLDFTRVLAGPYCTMVLADLGAEVIKIEAPNVGDDARAFGPYIGGESAYFMSLNRNKESITLNLKSKKAIEIVKELVKKADVVTENFKPGTMEKLGIGYEVLKEINPKIIFASTSGFGQTGPYSNRPAYDGVIQAMGGIMSITGQKGGEPTRVGPSIADIIAGLFTAIGVLSALNKRAHTGEGMNVDVSMLDCQVGVLENAISRYFVTGESPKPMGNRHASVTPFEPFDTKDGQIIIAVANDNLFAKLCKLLNLENLISHEKFLTNALRTQNYEELRPIIAEKMLQKSTEEWKLALLNAGIPSGPINNIEMLVNDEQVLFRNMIQEVHHTKIGMSHLPGIPIKISGCDDNIRFAAPTIGQHSEKILKHYLSYTDQEIEKMRQENVL